MAQPGLLAMNVRVAVLREPTHAPLIGMRRAARDSAEAVELRFGDETLLVAPLRAWTAARRALGGTVVRKPSKPLPHLNLHLVVQLGNLFQRAYPGVPVLLNKGRYLVVEMPPDLAAEASERDICCYTVRPLGESRTVFDHRPPGTGRVAREGWLQALVGGLSRPTIDDDLRHLTSFHTRHSLSDGFREAAAWARQRLDTLGYPTRTEAVMVGGGESLNIVAERAAVSAANRGVVIVTAHLDSVNSMGNMASAAPGADDNASGAAGVLAIASALAGHRGAHDLRFILFGGEEQGLYGSRQYVAGLDDAERLRIRAVINMDMVATRNTERPTVLIEGGQGVSEALVEGLIRIAASYTMLAVQTSLEPYNSDHVPFIDAGVPAVLTIEGADRANENVHTAADTVEHLDDDLMLQILAMNTVFVGEALGQPSGEILVSNRNVSDSDHSANRAKDLQELVEMLGNPFRFSGRYVYNGGASLRQGRSFVDSTGRSAAALDDPLYRLDQPVYLRHTGELDLAAHTNKPLRFTLHIDVDGAEPLGVVSGTVAYGADEPGVPSRHFIGRVTANEATPGGRRLAVGEFTFDWPDGDATVDRLEVELTGSPLAAATARATFHPRHSGEPFGPYVAARESAFFREVEVDVDVEADALKCEPFDTHVHPDRPGDVPQEILTLESAFARAGVLIERSRESGNVVPTPGDDRRWTYAELHDSMELHWQAFANKPQWKMWIFLAELGSSDSLGGVMFDGEIDEPGGVDRQGTAIFTRCPYFHTVGGGYIQANPPFEEAVKRELFFNLMHETGHAFNLAHSFQKELGEGWEPPPWMPLRNDPQALSWMNYPDSATPGGGAGANASWFYRRFRYRFEAGELLFLRHAPETYVEMGGESWFEKHGRVSRISVEPRLELLLRGGRTIELYKGTAVEVELGEPVILELRLKNVSLQPLRVHANLDPSDGLVELAVTDPGGRRRPFLPFDHTRTELKIRELAPEEKIWQSLDLTMGAFGFPFKEPGPYRVEATYRNIDGSAAAAVLQVNVRPAPNPDVVPVVRELYDARVGRTLYVEGTRVMEDVNDKLHWVEARMADLVGERNPLALHLRTVRHLPLATPSKQVDPESGKLRRQPEEPDVVAHELEQVVGEQCEAAAKSMGHIWLGEVLRTYVDAAEAAGEPAMGRKAIAQVAGIFKARGVVQSVLAGLHGRARELDDRSRPTRKTTKAQTEATPKGDKAERTGAKPKGKGRAKAKRSS